MLPRRIWRTQLLGGARWRLARVAPLRQTSAHRVVKEATTMQRIFFILLAAGVLAGPALAQEVDIKKAVHCATLSQQFGDSLKAAKVEDQVKKAASDLAKQGDQACMAHDYDTGLDQLRQALEQIKLKPIV
jgi:hypothetical protein